MKTNVFHVELAAARKRLRLTQDQVCSFCGIAETATLSRWENGREIPSMNALERLAELYGDALLQYLYLQQCTSIGAKILPPIARRDLGNSVLLLQKEHTDINRIKDALIAIACDGVIDKDEEVEWDSSLREIRELASACMGLALAQIKMPSQGCNLERAIGLKN